LESYLIDFTKNQGYGAAIKGGFERAKGTIISFLDADRRCDPCLCIMKVKKDVLMA